MPKIDIDTTCLPLAKIYLWQITETPEELSNLLANGDEMLCMTTDRFGSRKRQCEWLATRVLLQHTPYKDAEILYHTNGAPYLSCGDIHISISHTQGYVAIAIADTPIGLDIEHSSRDAMRVIDAYLQPQEVERLWTEDDPTTEALRLWTVKEAAFKLHAGKADVLKEIHTQPSDNSRSKDIHNYIITYYCGTKARCLTTALRGLFISCCSNSMPTIGL